jgi:hypothetical protein
MKIEITHFPKPFDCVKFDLILVRGDGVINRFWGLFAHPIIKDDNLPEKR